MLVLDSSMRSLCNCYKKASGLLMKHSIFLEPDLSLSLSLYVWVLSVVLGLSVLLGLSITR